MKAALAGIVVLAAILRFHDLPARPMHADEAIQADRLGVLLETGRFEYEPSDYHGPLLAYLTLPVARASGARTYEQLSETTIRTLPSLCGVLLVLIAFVTARRLSPAAGWMAGLLAAVAPAGVYYSRFFIPELPFAAISGAALYCAVRYMEEQRLIWAMGCGLAAGLAFATKETAVFAALSLAAGAVASGVRPRLSHAVWLAAGAVAAAGAALGPGAFMEALAGLPRYAERALRPELHGRPWHFYWGLLARSGEILVLAPAAFAFAPASRRRPAVRFLLAYTGTLALLYSAVSYKTPWCIVGVLHGLVLLAGIGAAQLGEDKPRGALAIAGLLGAGLGLQAARLAGPLSSDAENPYAYAQTTRDVYVIAEGVREAAGGGAVEVFTDQNWWPLPWYFRGLDVTWHRDAPVSPPAARVLLAAPDLEDELARAIYELPPPGERRLYTQMFDRAVFLRPGVEVRGFRQADRQGDVR